MPDIPVRLSTALADRYALERALGQGGMATVYLAEDLRHDRKVAVKVLKPELAAVIGAERFVVEIKTTAALQHPHILPLFDSGSADGFLYYVMPFIDGETLRAKLDRETQLGVDEAVGITTAVADALDYAHRHGVIHRDIKPENILLHDGRPMVADFGIALALSAAAGGRMTETGLSLGTPHYMSPEQATAEKEITARSDVYSLGSVCYEMLTGDPPHTGANAQQIIMKIVTEDAAPVTKVRKNVPTHVAAAVGKAIEKLPADRFATAREFAEALTNPAFTTARVAGGAVRPSAGPPVRLAAALAALALLATAAAVWGWLRGTPAPAPAPPTAFTLEPPYSDLTLGTVRSGLVISPDGRTIAMLVRYADQDVMQIAVRELGQIGWRVLPGTEGALDLTFSPDGHELAFRRGLALMRMSVRGASPVRVGEIGATTALYGMAWVPSDTIYYLIEGPRELYAMPADGSGPATTIALTEGAGVLSELYDVPGTEWLLTVDLKGAGGQEVAVVSRRTGEVRGLKAQGAGARLLPDGRHLLLAKGAGGVVTIAPFDTERLAITGPEVPVLEGVYSTLVGLPHLAISATGTLVYVTGTVNDRTIVEVARDGRERTLVGEPGNYQNPRWSPDGGRIAFQVAEQTGGDIWVQDLRSGTRSRITSTEGENFYPLWTPDGSRLVFASRRSGLAGLWSQPVDGSSEATRVGAPRDSLLRFPHDITPDGRELLYRTNTGELGMELGVLTLAGADSGRPVLSSPQNEKVPEVSPDGRWLVYASDLSGTDEVYVTPWPAVGPRSQISSGGGQEPRWHPDGREIFYRLGDAMLRATLDVSGPLPRVATRDTLFSGPYVRLARWAEYDVSRDGQRFLMIRRGTTSQQVTVITNWVGAVQAQLTAAGAQ